MSAIHWPGNGAQHLKLSILKFGSENREHRLRNITGIIPEIPKYPRAGIPKLHKSLPRLKTERLLLSPFLVWKGWQ